MRSQSPAATSVRFGAPRLCAALALLSLAAGCASSVPTIRVSTTVASPVPTLGPGDIFEARVFGEADMIPLPCNPTAISIGYGLRNGDKVMPVTAMIPKDSLSPNCRTR